MATPPLSVAVLLLGPILFVAAIDCAYLPWVYEHVRRVITAMLVVDLVLLMLDQRTRIWVFGLVALGDDSSRKYWSLELVVGVLLVSGVIVPFLWAVRHFELDYGDLIGRPPINGRGTWNIKSFPVDHTADLQAGNESAEAYFDFDGSCYITGLRNSPINCRFEPNGRLHTIKVTRFPLGPSLVSLEGKYEVAGSTLRITGTTGSHQISVLLSRSGW